MDLANAQTGPFTPTAVHQRLARLVGAWKGTARTYADPSHPEAFETAPWEGSIGALLGGRFLRFAYTSHAFGQPTAGELTIAYESGDRIVRLSWIDSLHTSPAILVSTSEPLAKEGEGPSTLVASGTYFAGEGAPRWGWRTELDDRDAGTLRIRMFNIEPEGGETLGVAIDLERVP